LKTTTNHKGALSPSFEVVIPVYKNEDSISQLLETLDSVASDLNGDFRVLFVDDGSPDDSVKVILDSCDNFSFGISVIRHSRNFGSFSAIRTGLKYSTANYIGVISADLQEPPSLLLSFFSELQKGKLDIVFGTRINRSDPRLSRFMSSLYWKVYRKFINKDIPIGGVDVFACTNQVANEINKLGEGRTSLIGMLFWVGYRRGFVGYKRHPRKFGKSSWTIRNKFKYMADSVFSFSDLPIRFIRLIGIVGVFLTLILSSVLFVLAAQNAINVPGYAPLMLVILFGSSANLVALGVLGSYIWRSFELAQSRPIAIVRKDMINS
jgi:glycosyltransferase involved in cell wall biosynthesis